MHGSGYPALIWSDPAWNSFIYDFAALGFHPVDLPTLPSWYSETEGNHKVSNFSCNIRCLYQRPFYNTGCLLLFFDRCRDGKRFGMLISSEFLLHTWKFEMSALFPTWMQPLCCFLNFFSFSKLFHFISQFLQLVSLFHGLHWSLINSLSSGVTFLSMLSRHHVDHNSLLKIKSAINLLGWLRKPFSLTRQNFIN